MDLSHNLTLFESYDIAARSVPDETAIFYFRNRISFAKLSSLIEKWASILQNDFNVKKGDYVLVSLPNIPQTIILFYAINKIGAISNMVHPYTPEEKMQEYYDECRCKVAFLFDKRVYKELKRYKQFEGNIVICEAQTYISSKYRLIYERSNNSIYKALKRNSKFTFFRNFKENEMSSISQPLSDSEVSVLLHSASTTGEAKAIQLSAKSFNFTASRVSEIMCMKPDEFIGKAMISVLPSFHGFGLCMTMHAPLVNRFGVALIPKYSAANVAKMMKTCKCAISICGVPPVFKSLISEPAFVNCGKYLRELRSCFSGGDSLPSNVKEHFDSIMIKNKSKCRLFEGYGLTEALSVCCVNTHRHHKFGSIGYPIKGVTFKILDDQNNEVERGIVGEIAIKCENIMLGYYNNEKATLDTYHDGFLKTGDMGYMDNDDFLYFTSRRKRVIKVNGVAVFPHEIEEVISHIPGVKGVCVIQIPDEFKGHASKAVVVADFKDPEVIMSEVKKHLISWAIPKEVEFVNKLPKTKFNKTDWSKVQQAENKKRGIIEQ